MADRHNMLIEGAAKTFDRGAVEARIAPVVRGQKVKRALGVQQILEWAFGRECVRIDTDPTSRLGGQGAVGFGMEYVLLQRQILGCRVDTSVGRSSPHEDAEIVAAIVENLPQTYGGLPMALRIAEYARAGTTPDWLPGARTRVVPKEWSENQFGVRASTAVAEVISYRHRGRMVKREVRCCPVTYTPSASQIAAARRGYLDWWGALHHIRHGLGLVRLSDIDVTDAMPPMEPWRRR
ncbi:hypothetical protein OEW28_18695 [Defluviimonas sp. WL0002]|uniref:Transposase n=1 Tax=Albidovulum marisflavi TaxID=2984159 RepID=A0ABT2ZIU2_9RHOB|nr:hypothetical protein [Defluviimonas sp. WL0002]MCV2870646.1 hypothetical protein [Defluviimonas sp. WL0002]